MANILIVEDDFEVSQSLADILTTDGHLTRIARNGLEGLQEVARQAPDVILLDIEMPILDGPGMADALAIRRAGQPSIPIVLISASQRLQNVARQLRTPHYLRKPFAIRDLLSIVGAAFGAQRR